MDTSILSESVNPMQGLNDIYFKGTLKAPTEHGKFSTDTWISFWSLDDLTMKGGGYLDGQGKFAWPFNDCSKNSNCEPLPISISFNFVNNSRIHHLKSINSKNTYFSIFACYSLDITKVKITAPEDSPNTDGFRIGLSRKIKISSAVIGIGDDLYLCFKVVKILR
ncbi:exopolygalacturonase-like [Olea europaea var. sylvestris]|uniref:exopolygalacturonase-like n=1 Tax=Olea europaea var. sylvestris TaxID=158386 RepID=UPI000C1D866B|nr:exopolygalacturonase-like [Olea europaea var. sylvestris]